MDEFTRQEQQLKQQRGNSVSWYERVVPDLSDEQRSALDEALANRDISARAISIVLSNWGYTVKEHTIGTWRRHRGLR